jgi:hypothetical protein
VKQRVLARDLPKPNKPQPTTAASAATTQEDDRVTTTIDVSALRSRLQLSESELPDDATPEQINAVLASDPSTPEPQPELEAEPQPTPEPEPQPEPTALEPDPIAATQARTLQETTQRIAQLEAAAAARAETETRQRRDALATQWVTEGRIAPAERDHYRQLLDVSEDRTIALASSLAANRVPVRERGYDDPAAAASGGNGITSTGWFPQLTTEA